MNGELPTGVATRTVARSLLVQGSWNYETLIGTGFAFSLLPGLRWIHAERDGLEATLARHASLFNSHPYLTTLAAGAVLRLERDGAEPAKVDRFKTALRGALGSLGDQLFWRAWRPLALLLGMALLLVGVPWWAALPAVFLIYNAAHLATRAWGLRAGYRWGLQLGVKLREVPLPQLAARAAGLAGVLTGVVLALTADWAVGLSPELIAPLGGAVAGYQLGPRARPGAAAALVVGALVILILIWF